MTYDIFGTGQTKILGLCYLFGKTHKQSTVAPLKSLKLTHSTKLLHLLRRTIRCKQSLRLKYTMIKLKPRFHMIATIAVIAAIAESGFHMIAELFVLSDRCDHSDRSDHMETGLNLLQ